MGIMEISDTAVSYIAGLFTGHDPTRGSGQGGFKISRVGSGRVKRFSKSRGSGRVMTREIRVTSRVKP